jgi:xanthine dehydrogenase accessory factor
MRDILPELTGWHRQQKLMALATVVETWGSSPRRPGAKMAVTSEGEFAGSVSGGCVESAVIEAATDTLRSHDPMLLHFGVTDDAAWAVGLACGGSLDVFVQPLDLGFFESVRSVLVEEKEAVSVVAIRGPREVLGQALLVRSGVETAGSGLEPWKHELSRLAEAALSQGRPRRTRLGESLEFFLEPIVPSPTLITVGAVHIAAVLVSLAKRLGYRTIVIDPRKAWGNAQRFPDVDQLIQAWPDEAFQQVRVTHSSAIAMLTHDPKLDDPALKIALAGPAFYVGALGSTSTHARRRSRLQEAGMTEQQLRRLHAPIGLDIGAESPDEIALAIMGQIVQARRRPAANTASGPKA